MLAARFTSRYERDVKSLVRRHCDIAPLAEVIDLILSDTDDFKMILRQRHNMHALKGSWAGSNECHAANASDWLVIWKTGNGLAVFQRTGSHDELFR
jgi:mRNA interferase YafQ